MFEIEGTYETAKCYATNIEETAIEQIRAMCNMPFTEGANVAIMPDAHAGAGCTIGTTMKVSDAAVPNIVGVDIGCGMYTVELGKGNISLPDFDDACHAVPSGKNVWEGKREHFDLEELRCYRNLNQTKRILRSIGTLGGGNHFIEIDVVDDGTQYLVIHSGSRNLGKQVAEYYQALAVDLHSGKEEFFEERDKLIAAYKVAGRRAEIQDALVELRAKFEGKDPDVPADLCWLYGRYLEDYRMQMTGVYTTSVSERTLDEAPDAYKAADDIMGPIGEAVDVVDVMRPIYNFKAQD